jgi:hypothetical protein
VFTTRYDVDLKIEETGNLAEIIDEGTGLVQAWLRRFLGGVLGQPPTDEQALEFFLEGSRPTAPPGAEPGIAMGGGAVAGDAGGVHGGGAVGVGRTGEGGAAAGSIIALPPPPPVNAGASLGDGTTTVGPVAARNGTVPIASLPDGCDECVQVLVEGGGCETGSELTMQAGCGHCKDMVVGYCSQKNREQNPNQPQIGGANVGPAVDGLPRPAQAPALAQPPAPLPAPPSQATHVAGAAAGKFGGGGGGDTAAVQSSRLDPVEGIKKLWELKNLGVLTEAEFAAKKAELLAQV